MSTMAVSSGVARKSTLNPHAPLFIPMAFQQVEDFSPEWWELVKTTTWFREHWFREHQDQENFDAEDEDVTNLLPDSFDEFSTPEMEFDDAGYYLEDTAMRKESLSNYLEDMAMRMERLGNGFMCDAEAVERSLGLKSPKNSTRPLLESAKYREKPVQRHSPKYSQRHIIQQPR